MTNSLPATSHRFVLVWRTERREIAGAEEVRRGWIEKVPDPRASERGEERPERVGFHTLSELPGLIERLCGQDAAEDRKDRRSPS